MTETTSKYFRLCCMAENIYCRLIAVNISDCLMWQKIFSAQTSQNQSRLSVWQKILNKLYRNILILLKDIVSAQQKIFLTTKHYPINISWQICLLLTNWIWQKLKKKRTIFCDYVMNGTKLPSLAEMFRCKYKIDKL